MCNEHVDFGEKPRQHLLRKLGLERALEHARLVEGLQGNFPNAFKVFLGKRPSSVFLMGGDFLGFSGLLLDRSPCNLLSNALFRGLEPLGLDQLGVPYFLVLF